MGHDPTHKEGVGQILPQGGPQADGEATLEKEGRHVDIPSTGRCNGEGGPSVGGDLCLTPPEHSHTVYFNQDHYEPVSGGVAEIRATGIQAVVRVGRDGCGGDQDSGSGGGTDRTAVETDN